MSSLPKNFCIAPFTQLTTHPSGTFSPCPYLGGTTWNIGPSSFLEKWTSTEFNALRSDFLNNVQSSICNRCWHEESAGKKSLRLRLLDPETLDSSYQLLLDETKKQEILDLISDGSYIDGPKMLSIKNGNVCNAKCRSCHPEDSSPWIQDANKLYAKTKKKYYKIGIKESNWSDKQIEHLIELLPTLERLELFGGEPLYNKKVMQLLDHAIKSGHSRHISLYVNTNGSVDILKRIPDIEKFHDIDIGVSIDAIPQHFSYVRHPLCYETVEENISAWIDCLKNKGIPYVIQSISTVSIFNIYYLPELLETVKKLTGHAPYWNLLVTPKHLSIATLPDEIKKAVVTKLEKHGGFGDLINYLEKNKNTHEHLREFFEITDGIDLIRNESFKKTFGEFATLMERYRPDPSGIRVFIGDLSQEWPGQYLKHMARTHGDESCQLLVDGNHDKIIIKDQDWRATQTFHEVAVDMIPDGYYYTGLTEWKNLDKLRDILKKSIKIYYIPPHTWSDGPEEFTTLQPPRGWTGVLTEEILDEFSNVIVIDPVD